jgi:N-acetylneuraminic acid mutarotase
VLAKSRRILCISSWVFSFAIVTAPGSTVAQTTAPNQWTWISGSDLMYQSGVYGTMGTPSANNFPGSRSNTSQWIDENGNLWLFGGLGVSSSKPWGELNDLWVFDPATAQWTWKSGSSSANAQGTYGTLGLPDGSNVPGARFNAASGSDKNGNLWLFGGAVVDSTGSSSLLNDVWKFEPSTNQWTWMGGSNTSAAAQTGVYGTLGTAAIGNIPGAREATATWTDANGHFWFFGGLQFDSKFNSIYLSDLWSFDPSENLWTWIGGPQASNASPGQSGVYGTLRVPEAANIPGGRDFAATWIDANGNLWLFGGNGIDANGNTGYLNDLWMFSIATGQWTWMSGSSTITANSGPPGTYGILGRSADTNIPGGRSGASAWTDSYGRLWMLGGYGSDSAGNLGNLGDLWMFNQSLNEWTWMGGSNTIDPSGTYGTLGVPAPANIPGARGTSATWSASDGTLWLFGGFLSLPNNQFNLYTDLWAYQPQAPSATETPTFSIASGTFASAQTLAINDATPSAAIYYTIDGNTPSTSSTRYVAPLTVSTTETVKAIAIASGFSPSPVASSTYTIASPAATPVFSVPAGTFTSIQSVAITDATVGAVIYYTTDGTTPTSASTVYGGPITVSKSETLKAIATASGFSTSAVATSSYTINLPSPDFSIATSPQSLTVVGGTNGTLKVTVTPQNGFDAAVSFSCSGLPAGASCAFSPSTVTPSGGSAASTTLTIATSRLSSSLQRGRNTVAAQAVLAALIFCFAARGKRRRGYVFMAVVAASVLLVNGCGGKGESGGGSDPVTSTVTITATSGSLRSTSTFAITVN